MDPSVPFIHEPVDTLRQGLASARENAQSDHPLQHQMAKGLDRERREKLDMMRNVYGAAVPLKLQIEEQILASVQRLPGLPSSRLGAEALSGKLDDFDFSDALGQRPDESEIMQPSMHEVMEYRLGLAKTVPTRELP